MKKNFKKQGVLLALLLTLLASSKSVLAEPISPEDSKIAAECTKKAEEERKKSFQEMAAIKFKDRNASDQHKQNIDDRYNVTIEMCKQPTSGQVENISRDIEAEIKSIENLKEEWNSMSFEERRQLIRARNLEEHPRDPATVGQTYEQTTKGNVIVPAPPAVPEYGGRDAAQTDTTPQLTGETRQQKTPEAVKAEIESIERLKAEVGEEKWNAMSFEERRQLARARNLEEHPREMEPVGYSYKAIEPGDEGKTPEPATYAPPAPAGKPAPSATANQKLPTQQAKPKTTWEKAKARAAKLKKNAQKKAKAIF